MVKKSTLKFLSQLAKNNNREWFHAHQEEYVAAKDNIQEVIEELIIEVGKFDPSVRDLAPKDALFRIYRDVRFSKNKIPYKSSFGAVVSKGGKKGIGPAFYVHIEPKNTFVYSGVHHPTSEELGKIRRNIAAGGKELKKFLNSKAFKTKYKTLLGSKLKTAPKGYPKDHPEIELLRYKDFGVRVNIPMSKVTSKGFEKEVAKEMKAMKPFTDYLRKVTGT